jgi:hypothetical protein
LSHAPRDHVDQERHIVDPFFRLLKIRDVHATSSFSTEQMRKNIQAARRRQCSFESKQHIRTKERVAARALSIEQAG